MKQQFLPAELPTFRLHPRELLPSLMYIYINSGADKSLARPGRKQATATEDFDVHISYL